MPEYVESLGAMMRVRSLILAVSAVLLGGCATLGLDDHARDQHLSQAEPLFGKELDNCLDDPGTLLGIASDRTELIAAKCRALAEQLSPIVRAVAANRTLNVDELDRYDKRRRNEIIDALVAVSNRKCADYAAFLKTHDGQTNSSLSILAILTGGLGGFVGGQETAQALSGTSAILSGSRAALNDTWFSNQTIHVLVSGFEKVRERQARDLSNRKACPISDYSVMAGVGDALRYHGACSLLTGLSEAAQAIDRSDQPGLETMRRQLADLQSISAQASNLIHATYSGDPVQQMVLRDREISAKALQDQASQSLVEAKAALKALQDNPASIPEGASFDSALTIASERVSAAEKALGERQTAYLTASEAHRKFIEDDKRSRLASQESAGQPGNLERSSSQFSICPFTPPPEARRSQG